MKTIHAYACKISPRYHQQEAQWDPAVSSALLRRLIHCLSVCVLVVLASCSPKYQGPVPGDHTISLGMGPELSSPAAVGGFNISNAMNLAKIKDDVISLAPPSYTWPAGNVGDDYLISAQEVDFLRIQRKLVPDAPWFYQVNLFKGGLEGALAQVRKSAELGIMPAYWTIGNEADLYDSHRGAPEWTPEYYARVFREWTAAIKAEFPDAKFAGPAISNPYDNWMEVFIAECGDLVDVLTWHWYPTNGKLPVDQALASSRNADPMVRKYQDWLKDPVRNPKGYQREIRTAVTEFALHWDTNNEAQIADQTGALWIADVLYRFARSELDYSHYFCLHTYGGHAVFSGGSKPRPTYWPFAYFATLRTGARFLDPMDDPGRLLDGPLTVAAWINSAGKLEVVLGNRSDETVFGLTLVLPAAAALPETLASASKLQVLGSRRLLAGDAGLPDEGALNPGEVGFMAGTDATSIGSLVANLPARSLVHLTLGKP